MFPFKLAMLFVVLAALAGCSVQQERSEEQETSAASRKKKNIQPHFQHLDIVQAQA